MEQWCLSSLAPQTCQLSVTLAVSKAKSFSFLLPVIYPPSAQVHPLLLSFYLHYLSSCSAIAFSSAVARPMAFWLTSCWSVEANAACLVAWHHGHPAISDASLFILPAQLALKKVGKKKAKPETLDRSLLLTRILKHQKSIRENCNPTNSLTRVWTAYLHSQRRYV